MHNFTDEQVLDLLLKENYITEKDSKDAKEYAAKHKASVLEYLNASQLISRDILGQAFAEFYGVPYADLNSNPPLPETVITFPEDIARKYNLLFLKEDNTKLYFTTCNFEQIDEIKKVLDQLHSSKKIIISYSVEDDIRDILLNYKKSFAEEFAQILDGETPIPVIVEKIIKDAQDLNASDIHFEPSEKEVLIRFRVDGVLQEVVKITKEIYENISNRIKILAHLRIDQHFSTQDGAIRMVVDNKPLDLRISVIPILDGQKIVIRLLSQYIRELNLGDLGLSSQDQDLLEIAYKKTFGMILTTGPTGSGKTTTLYATLKKLHTTGVNITTIEDPVEYRIPGVNQIQVNTDTDITFAKGLRSIVRQDPNIILVGEIRDSETSEIAINAALTGHLLLSTFHANDASTAIPRLIDMGAEPFLLSSTLNLIIAQRLVRKICASCRHSIIVKRKDLKKEIPDPEKYFEDETITIYEGKGCKVCNGTGFKGRCGIYELLYMTAEMQELILKNPSSLEIRALSLSQGAHTFFDDGITKVKNGVTTIQEILRVAPLNVDVYASYTKPRKQ